MSRPTFSAAELAAELPIAEILQAVLEAAGTRDLVIEAPPGAGKTTIVPVSLLEIPGIPAAGSIVVLQPRRLAARMSALRVASLLGEPVGERVGYQVRFDRKGSGRTRLWFMTEGILLRRLREDPSLRGVAAVILDEFHERHLEGDLALSLLRRLQRTRAAEEPLRLIVMSATLDAAPVADFLGAARLQAEGRSYPVEIEYRTSRSRDPSRRSSLEGQVAGALRELVERELVGGSRAGHVLVFLPGAREIRACEERCAAIARAAGLEIFALHGQLPREQQDRAVFELGGRSKLILSTNVAESSITIDGVVAVIDSGLARVADFDPSTGLPRLSLGPISRASATQRAGRAGRTGPGICVRLYSRSDHDHRPSHDLPEVRRLDLAGPLLELAAAGIALDGGSSNHSGFEWFEEPPEAAVAVARELLVRLGAIEADSGALTEIGEAMLRFPLHPRLARLLAAGVELEVGKEAARAAAILSERPLRGRSGPPPRTTDADLLDEIEVVFGRGRRRAHRDRLDPGTLARVRRAARQLEGLVRTRGGNSPDRSPEAHEAALRQALLAAHPDRVALVRADEHDRRTLVFAFGGSAELGASSGVRSSTWVVALRSEERREGTRRRAIVDSACAIDPEWLIDLFPDAILDHETIEFDPERERVVARSSLRYGKLTIESSELPKPPPQRVAAVLLEAARAAGAQRFCVGPRDDTLAQLQARAAWLHERRPDLPALDDELVDAVLARLCTGLSSFAELEQAGLLGALRTELGLRAGDPGALDRLAPARVHLPGGRKLTVHYERDRPPWVGSRLQDFFGMARGPTILDGAEPLVVHLRAPNRHDVAVTSDLAGFWRDHYPEIRKRLSRRYPKHSWPEDPQSAKPPHPGGRRRKR